MEQRPAKLDEKLESNKLELPKYSYQSDYSESACFDVSTHDLLSLQPLVPDVYEQDQVCEKVDNPECRRRPV